MVAGVRFALMVRGSLDRGDEVHASVSVKVPGRDTATATEQEHDGFVTEFFPSEKNERRIGEGGDGDIVVPVTIDVPQRRDLATEHLDIRPPDVSPHFYFVVRQSCRFSERIVLRQN